MIDSSKGKAVVAGWTRRLVAATKLVARRKMHLAVAACRHSARSIVRSKTVQGTRRTTAA